MPASTLKSASTLVNNTSAAVRVFSGTTGHTVNSASTTLDTGVVPDGSGETLLRATTTTNDNSNIGFTVNLEDRLYSGRFALSIFLDGISSTSTYAEDPTISSFHQQRLGIGFRVGGSATNAGHFYNVMLNRGWNTIQLSRAMLANVARNGSSTAIQPQTGGTGCTALSLGASNDGTGSAAATGSTLFDTVPSGLQLQLQLFGAGSSTSSRFFAREIVDNYQAESKTCLIFDDARITVYTDAFPLMQNRGLVGTLPIISSLVGTTGYMSVAQINELFRAGWDIVNHTRSHLSAATMAAMTQAECLTEILECDRFIAANGWNRRDANKYFVAPFGGHQNQNAVNYRAALTEAGCLATFGTTNRCTASQLISPTFIPRIDFNTLLTVAGTGYGIATMVDQYTNAVMSGASPMLMLHQFVNVPTSAIDLATSELETLLDRVLALKNAGFTSVEGVTTAIPAMTQGIGTGIRNLR
jgi:hypothetical protein